MKELRSSTTTSGRRMAGARALWRANGMKEEHFSKPIIGICNSFTQLVPGHSHLHQIGQFVKSEIEKLGCFAAEFNTIAIDDGIAMGHSGMLYSLPSRDLIADSVEYMANAHQIDAMVCISNCDKITPGMLMAAMRINIPTIFISGGAMEAGVLDKKPLDLVDAMVAAADNRVSDSELKRIESACCPGCGSCSGMFTANSMNCLNEALGLALPGNGTIVATHTNRKRLFEKGAEMIVKMAMRHYFEDDNGVLPRSIATKAAFENAMTLDIAMGGSTNTVLHLLAIASEAGVDFNMSDIDRLSRKVPVLCKVSPASSYHIEDVNRAGGVMAILGELAKCSLIDTSTKRVDYKDLKSCLNNYLIESKEFSQEANNIYLSAPLGAFGKTLGSQNKLYDTLDRDRSNGCIRDIAHAYDNDGGVAVLTGNLAINGSIVKSAAIEQDMLIFSGTAIVFESQEDAVDGILNDKVKSGDVVVIRYEGPKGGPGMQEMLYPTSYLKSKHLEKSCALITDGRFSGGSSGLSIGHISPEAAAGGAIALIKDGDIIEIDIPKRSIHLKIDPQELSDRRVAIEHFKPTSRDRKISSALKAYSMFVSSADRGAIRVLPK